MLRNPNAKQQQDWAARELQKTEEEYGGAKSVENNFDEKLAVREGVNENNKYWLGNLRAPSGYLRVPLGYLRAPLGFLRAVIKHSRSVLIHFKPLNDDIFQKFFRIMNPILFF